MNHSFAVRWTHARTLLILAASIASLLLAGCATSEGPAPRKPGSVVGAPGQF